MKDLNILELIDFCSREWRQLIELLAKQHKLTFLEWRILVCICAANKIEQQVLTKQLNLLSNNTITNVDSLVKKGFLKKTIKTSDKKIRILTLTKKKEGTVKQIKKLNDQIYRSCFSRFDKEAVSMLEDGVWKTLESLREIHDKFI
jgi:DNA-binding MarR family transcriptional regulator